ncbi:hypothetical protein BCR36DRAFT_585867 [Piromyces finnis]|uniref:Nop52-domain-containing protein n=1 Tax=Piromyces finnis TaxID=1754191 RepID=A0A1Y1V285_9FUNG|nr:hypothetical protein BCR36DRAFT_585867 [Piromyces finnis]|eukprot:ORX44989.1 hypothetical protein BCR36DRAFT_585867 [Piromyces finnis]
MSSAKNSFGKALASADKSVRDKAVKKLSKYLSNKKDLSELDLLKLWKGLFYCFWMSDKPLVQQQLSEKLASLILKIPEEIAIKFIEAFWKEIRLEWNGVDRLRLDKFYYLFRQMHLYSFKFLEKVNWDTTYVIKYMDIYTDGPLSLLDQTVPPSLLYHSCEVFITELEKAISKPIPSTVFIEILEPFVDVVGFCSNDILVERVIDELFLKIVNIYENEDANEEEESNIIKSCDFVSVYKRLEKLSGEALVLKKNLEHIESLIVIFKGLAETQKVFQNEEVVEDEIIAEAEDPEEINEVIEIDEVEEVKTTPKSKGKGKGKAAATKAKKNNKKEKPIEIDIEDDDNQEKKAQKKRKAPIEPVEIEEKEDDVEVIETPKKRKKTTPKAAAAKKTTNAKTRGKNKTKVEPKQESEEVIEIKESDEESKQPKSEPKLRKSKRLNQKKKAAK